jgi:hypothetical protein
MECLLLIVTINWMAFVMLRGLLDGWMYYDVVVVINYWAMKHVLEADFSELDRQISGPNFDSNRLIGHLSRLQWPKTLQPS